MSSSFTLKLDDAGFPLRIYRLASEFNLMFWKIQTPKTPTNLCPYMQTLFFFPLAAMALLGLFYGMFFRQVGIIVTNLFGNEGYRIVAWGLAQGIIGVVLGVSIIFLALHGIKRLVEHLVHRRDIKTELQFRNSGSLPDDVTAAGEKSDPKVKGANLLKLLAVWWETIHNKTCVPISVISQSTKREQ